MPLKIVVQGFTINNSRPQLPAQLCVEGSGSGPVQALDAALPLAGEWAVFRETLAGGPRMASNYY